MRTIFSTRFVGKKGKISSSNSLKLLKKFGDKTRFTISFKHFTEKEKKTENSSMATKD